MIFSIRKLLSTFIILMTLTAIIYAAEAGPTEMLRSVANAMLDGLKSNKATLQKNPAVVYSLAKKIIVPHADLDEMSKRVLPPRAWISATPAQRAMFKKEFTTTLIRTYASALASYKNQIITFYPIRGGYQGRSIISVNSQIESADGPPVSVSYSLLRSGNNWKLYDMTVEGVSMLQSFRSQFSDQLSRGNMMELLKVLQEHNVNNNVKDQS